MARPPKDDLESQILKYEQHKKANGILKHYIETSNLIAAYVIAFSLLEDRIRAMFVVYERDINNKSIKDINIKGGISNMVRKLIDAELLEREIGKKLFTVFDKRNPLLHEAMWNLDTFHIEDITEIKKLKSAIQNTLNKLKRSIK